MCSLPLPYRVCPGMLLPVPSEQEPLRAAQEPRGNTGVHLPDRQPPREEQMTKITSLKRNRDSSKVLMHETLNDAGNPMRGLLRPKNEGGGLLGEAQTWKSLQGVHQKQTDIYNMV